MASLQTTNLGAIVSQKTLPSDGTAGTLFYVPAGGVLRQDEASKFFSRLTTASLTSLTLSDGEMAVVQSNATNLRIFMRSGDTTYVWPSLAGSVL